jgi:hypothetical protein
MKFIFIFVFLGLFLASVVFKLWEPEEHTGMYVFGTLILMVINMGVRRKKLGLSFISHYSPLSD